MTKAKSPKLRTLITLHALFKYTDEKHRLSSAKLNDFLRPFGLDCNKKVLMDTADRLQESGINVDQAGGGTCKGLCLTNRPLPDQELKRLIFAIETNPYISGEQAQELLSALKPAVTVYQEPLLCTVVENVPVENSGSLWKSAMYESYCVIHDAITKGHRVCCSRMLFEVDKHTGRLTKRVLRAETYLPRYFIKGKDRGLYMVSYNHSRQRIEALALADIAAIRPTQYNNLPNIPDILKMLDTVGPYDYLPEQPLVIYSGPVVFYCRSKCLQAVYDKFGAPGSLVERDERYCYTYPVPRAEITPEALEWLWSVPEQGVRIVGPAPLLDAVRGYYRRVKDNLLGENKALERSRTWQKKNP